MQKTNCIQIKDNRQYLILTISCILAGIALYIYGSVIKNNQGLWLLLFLLFYVFFPGWSFLGLTDPDSLKESGWRVLKAFYLGFFLLIIQYYLLNSLGVLQFIKVTPLILGIAVFAAACRRYGRYAVKPFIKENYRKEALLIRVQEAFPFFCLMVLFLLYVYLLMIKSAPSPDSSLFLDYPYHMGNVVTLTEGGELMDVRVAGMQLRYHYFVELFYAILRRVFPVDVFNCVLRYPVVLVPGLICGSVYMLMRTVMKNKAGCALAAGLLLFFSDIDSGYTHLTSHIGTNINSVGVALPCLVVLVYSLKQVLGERKVKPGRLPVLFALSVCTAGLKGPFCMVAAGGAVLMILVLIIREKRIPVAFICASAAVLFAFCIIWILLLRNGVNTDNVESGTGLLGVIKFGMTVPSPFEGLMSGESLRSALLIPLSIFYAYGSFGILFILAVISFLAGLRKKTYDRNYIFLVILSLLSLFCYYFLAVGRNKVYFLMAGAPFVGAVAVSWIRGFQNNEKVSVNLKRAVIIACSLIMSVSIMNGVKNPRMYVGIGVLSQDDIEAVRWLKANTSESDLIAITDYGQDENNKFFYYSAFSERHFYLETRYYAMNSGKTWESLQAQWEENNRLFENDNPQRNEEAKKLGIEYLVQIDYSGVFDTDLSRELEECFRSSTVRIYHVQ